MTTTEKSPLAIVGQFAFVIIAAVGVYSFVSVSREAETRRRCSATCLLRPDYSGYEHTAPGFTLKDISGKDVSLDDYRGKVVILNFWTQTCGPCMKEMPEIADLTRILEPWHDVAVVTVSTDEDGKAAYAALKNVLRGEPPFKVLSDPEQAVVRDKYGTSLFPETWVIDKRGVIRARFDTGREWSNSAVVEFVKQLRDNGFCPVQAKAGALTPESQRLCEMVTGS